MKKIKISEIDEIDALKSVVDKICTNKMSVVDRKYILAAIDRAYRLGIRTEETNSFWSNRYCGP